MRPLDSTNAPRSYAKSLSDAPEQLALTFGRMSGRGYAFAGWKLMKNGEFVDENSYTDPIYPDKEPYFIKASTDPDTIPTVTFDAKYIADVFGPNSKEGTAVYGAVWKPLTYRIVFNENRSGDTFDSYVIESAPADAYDEDAEHMMVTLPYPHTTANEKVFLNWSTEQTRTPKACRDWYGGAKVALTDILAATLSSEANAKGDFPEEDGCLIVKLFAIWNYDAVVNADVPLTVNILLDPWQPAGGTGADKVITNSEDTYVDADGNVVTTAKNDVDLDIVKANAWVGTPAANDARGGVRIESVTFEQGDASLFETKDGDNRSGLFDLLVYGGGRGESATPLRINLGQKSGTVVLRASGTDQSDHLSNAAGAQTTMDGLGFDRTITSANPLLLYYDLDFSRAGKNLVDYPMMTDQVEQGGINNGKTGKTIAKLYYTIGLVPTA